MVFAKHGAQPADSRKIEEKVFDLIMESIGDIVSFLLQKLQECSRQKKIEL